MLGERGGSCTQQLLDGAKEREENSTGRADSSTSPFCFGWVWESARSAV